MYEKKHIGDDSNEREDEDSQGEVCIIAGGDEEILDM